MSALIRKHPARGLTATWLAIAVACSALAACGDSEVTTGAWAEFRGSFPFSQGALSFKQEIRPDSEPEVGALKGQLTCGVLDLQGSYMALSSFDGTDGAPFTLKATIIDGADEITYFEWSSTLQANAKQITFGAADAGVVQSAVDRISQILLRENNGFDVRFTLDAPSGPSAVVIEVIQLFRVATEKGTCPSTQL